MSKWQIRVTRDLDGEYVDLEIEADTFFRAKMIAVNDAIKNQDTYFGEVPKPSFGVDPMDDDEESSRIVE